MWNCGTAAVVATHVLGIPGTPRFAWNRVTRSLDVSRAEGGELVGVWSEGDDGSASGSSLTVRRLATSSRACSPPLGPPVAHCQITACKQEPDGALRITLSNDETITVDHVIYATGYKADMARISC